MRLPRLRVRTYMLLVAVVAVLAWAAMVGLRWSDYSWRARTYSIQERYWRANAQRDLAQGKTRTIAARWGLRTADYFATLVRKYRRAMWRPWIPVDSEPPFWDVTTGQPCDPPWARGSPSTPSPPPPAEIRQRPPDNR